MVTCNIVSLNSRPESEGSGVKKFPSMCCGGGRARFDQKGTVNFLILHTFVCIFPANCAVHLPSQIYRQMYGKLEKLTSQATFFTFNSQYINLLPSILTFAIDKLCKISSILKKKIAIAFIQTL